jgi:hypothetical protein
MPSSVEDWHPENEHMLGTKQQDDSRRSRPAVLGWRLGYSVAVTLSK